MAGVRSLLTHSIDTDTKREDTALGAFQMGQQIVAVAIEVMV